MQTNFLKIYVTILIGFFTYSKFFSQIDLGNTRQGESKEYCFTHKKMNYLKQNPAFLQQFIQDQQILSQVEQQIAADSSHTRQIYKIPIVFHVLHNGGEENISKEQILDALSILNRDYRLLNQDANDVRFDFNASNPNAIATPTDIEVEFVLATKDPNGNCFSGITRTHSPLSYENLPGANSWDFGANQVNAIVDGNDIYNGEWPGNKYLNVFICGDIGGSAGYTFNPSNFPGTAMDNGIFITYDYIGSMGTSTVNHSRTLTHEVGHWLNLSHTWGPNNNPGNLESCNTDDGVADTPNTIGVTSCNLDENTCGPLANVENYMDYSYCTKMFTAGQKARMIAALNSNVGSRNNVWTTSNLTLVGADGDLHLCEADFYSDKKRVCVGSPIQYYDNSYHNITSWNWSFPSATTTTSTEQNPIVTYNTPGVYQVSLTVSDGNTSLTKTVNSYVTVIPLGQNIPFLEDFESYSNLSESNYWEIYNPQNNFAFEIQNGVGHTGSKCVKLNNFAQLGSVLSENIDELISNPMDLSDVTSAQNVTLSFRFSYRKKTQDNMEKLYVLLSGNCGETWNIRKTIQGNSLSSIVSSSPWAPTSASDWTTVHVTNIITQYWNDNFRYKFKFEGNGGNNLYLDNINIYPSGPSNDLVVGIEDISPIENSFVVYPNPVENEISIEYSLNNATITNIQVLDMLGQILIQERIQSSEGNNLVIIPSEKLVSGMYMVKVQINGYEFIKQIIIK